MAKYNKQNQNALQTWLKTNAYTLLVALVIIAMAWATMNAKIAALEAKVAEYPSQDWFELKFEVIGDDIEQLKSAVEAIK